MIRWHVNVRERRRSPDVVIGDTNLISCLKCGTLKAWATHPARNYTSGPLNTSNRPLIRSAWPSSVTYREKCLLGKAGRDLTPDLINSLGLEDGQAQPTDVRQEYRPSEGYHPLPTKDTIRIIILSPGIGNMPLHGRLQEHNLESGHAFEAVSYTWATEDGNSERSQPLFLGPDWDILPITANCQNMLRRFRDPDQTRKLWVDAICIDQGNPREQNHQVGMMARIYSSAKRCLVYLGEHDASSERAMWWLKYLQDDEDSEDDNHFVSLLFRRRYFTRLWVLQEIALAREIDIQCGNIAVPWNSILRYTNKFPKASDPSWVRNFDWFPSDGPEDFARLLIETSQTFTSDPRDRIFALFGMFRDLDRQGLVADYTVPFQGIYAGLAAFFAKKYGLLKIVFLCLCQRYERERDFSLPSWAPDWRRTTASQWSNILDGNPSLSLRRVFQKKDQYPCFTTAPSLLRRCEVHNDCTNNRVGET